MEVDNSSVSIILPPYIFNQLNWNSDDEISILFGMYDSSILFPLPEDSMLFTNPNVTYETFAVASTLVAATIVGFENQTFDMGTDFEVYIILKLHSEVRISGSLFVCLLISFHFQQSQFPLCVYWDKNAAGMINYDYAQGHY